MLVILYMVHERDSDRDKLEEWFEARIWGVIFLGLKERLGQKKQIRNNGREIRTYTSTVYGVVYIDTMRI